MFENISGFFKKLNKKEDKEAKNKETAKERLHLVLMQDRANVSADFLDLMKQEIVEVIKKYVDVDENELDVKLTNKINDDGTTGSPALYANIPIKSIKDNARSISTPRIDEEEKKKQETNAKKEEEEKKEKTDIQEQIKVSEKNLKDTNKVNNKNHKNNNHKKNNNKK